MKSCMGITLNHFERLCGILILSLMVQGSPRSMPRQEELAGSANRPNIRAEDFFFNPKSIVLSRAGGEAIITMQSSVAAYEFEHSQTGIIIIDSRTGRRTPISI